MLLRLRYIANTGTVSTGTADAGTVATDTVVSHNANKILLLPAVAVLPEEVALHTQPVQQDPPVWRHGSGG